MVLHLHVVPLWPLLVLVRHQQGVPLWQSLVLVCLRHVVLPWPHPEGTIKARRVAIQEP